MQGISVQKNFVDKVTFAAKQGVNIDVMRNGQLVRVDCGMPSSTFNVAVVLTDDLDAKTIEKDLIKYYKDKNYPFAVWCWEHLTKAKKHLDASSLTMTETAVAMVATADDLQIEKQHIADYQIKEIDSTQDMAIYAAILSSLWGDSLEAVNVRKYCNLLGEHNLQLNRANRFYLGYLKKKPVCAASVFYSVDTAGIYDLVTVNDYRKQGLASVMFGHLLAEIKRNGYSHYTLQASEAGANIYKQAGFKPVNTIYVYENEFQL